MMTRISPRADGESVRLKLNRLSYGRELPTWSLSLTTVKGIGLSLLALCTLSLSLAATVRGQEPDFGGERVKPPKNTRKSPRQPKPQLLSIRWQIQTIQMAGKNYIEAPIDPNAVDWSNVEGARLLVQPDQDGYLYIIAQMVERNNDVSQPQVLFYRGNIKTAKDSMIEVPPTGPGRLRFNNKIWWKLSGGAARPVVTVVFSRERIGELDRAMVQDKDRELGVDYGAFLKLVQASATPRRKSASTMAQASPRSSGSGTNLVPAAQTSPPAPGISSLFITNSSNPSRQEDKVLVEIIEIRRR